MPVTIGLRCTSSMETSSAATRRVRRMVELLGPDYPIISIDPHGLRGEPIPPSIEEMAADRLPLILERQASGPFLLGRQMQRRHGGVRNSPPADGSRPQG